LLSKKRISGGKQVKKGFCLVLGLVILLLLSVACSGGVSQDKYDKVNGDLAAAQVQAQKLQGDLTVKDTQLKTANDKLALAQSEIEIINTIFIPAFKGELDNVTETESMNLFLSMRDKVNAVGDSELTAKFQAIIDSIGSDEATLAFFIYLMEDISRTLK
jgi:hypothetical protein